ncbi:MAG: phage baseplate protein, partial [Bacteroidales bacterium]
LNKAYPRNRDLIKEGDDHIRLVKATLQNTFPGMDGALTAGTEKLNKLDASLTYDGSTIQINNNIDFKKESEIDFKESRLRNIGDPEDETDAVNLRTLQGSLMWPVGSIFLTISASNPNEILGFGTWEKFCSGRVLMGSGSTTDANNETPGAFVNESKGGQYNTKLEEKHTPAHSHAFGTLKVEDSGAHDHTIDARLHDYAVVNGNSWVVPLGDIAGESKRFQSTIGAKTSAGSGAHGHAISGDTAAFGKGESFSNMMPYMVCNMWVRKADAVTP